MSFDHIHFGAGLRGLGTVVPMGIAAQARVHVVVHGASELPSQPVLVCCVRGANDELEEIELAFESFSIADAIETLDPDALAAIDGAPELLLTTAITANGIAAQASFLLALAERRRGKRTIFVACDEDPGEAYAQLAAGMRELGVDVRRSLVNRLCLPDRRERQNGRRAVRVDEHAEWLIEGTPDSELLRALARVPGVAFTNHIDEHERRMQWLVDGPHLALALLAAGRNHPQITLEAVRSERDDWLERIYEILVPLVEQHCPHLTDTEAFARKQVAALMRHEDDVLETLKTLRRARPLPFLREVERKLGAPARAVVKSATLPPPELRRVFHELDRALSEIERYSDYWRYQQLDMHLNLKSDIESAAAYRALLAGVFPQYEVESRVLMLEHSLELHRDELAD